MMFRKREKERGLPRVRRRYRLQLVDESRLERVASVRAGHWRIVLAVLLLMGLGAGVAVLLMLFTPVKRQMPGNLTGDDRAVAMRALMRMDSLEASLQVNQAFMDNVATLLDTDRAPADSAASRGNPRTGLSLDSLIGSSARERKFVAMMEESEKYNLKVLSPLAAEGMIWADPMPDGIVLETTRTLPQLRFIVPVEGNVLAIADGRVIDRYFDTNAHAYVLTLQHAQGFVSRYSLLPEPLVVKGDQVWAGQRLTGPFGRKQRQMSIEMWRDGTPLVPAEYVGRKSVPVSGQQSIETPRGK